MTGLPDACLRSKIDFHFRCLHRTEMCSFPVHGSYYRAMAEAADYDDADDDERRALRIHRRMAMTADDDYQLLYFRIASMDCYYNMCDGYYVAVDNDYTYTPNSNPS